MRDARLLAVVTPSKQLPTDALRSPRAFGSRPSRPIRCGVVRVLDLPLLVVKTMESSGGRHDVRFDGVGRAALLGEHEPCPDEVALGTDEAGRPGPRRRCRRRRAQRCSPRRRAARGWASSRSSGHRAALVADRRDDDVRVGAFGLKGTPNGGVQLPCDEGEPVCLPLLELLGCDAADRDEHLTDPGVDNYCC